MEIAKRSIRLDDEVMAAIEALSGKTANDKLRGALIDRQTPLGDSPVVLETLELVRSLPDREDVEAIIDAALDRKIAARAGYGSPAANHCAHCGQDYPRPAGQPPASMCPQCRAAGHWNTGNCKPCAEAKHLAEVASLDSTGAGRSDIVYDA